MELPVKQFQTQGEQAFLDAFTAAEATLPGDKWVGELRRQAVKTYGMLGLPHRRVEAWKYTDLRSLLTEAYPLAEPKPRALSKAEIARGIGDRLAAIPAYRLVIAQGALVPALSDLAGLAAAGAEIVSLADALRKPAPWLKKVLGETRSPSDAVIALNTALMTGGAVLRLAKNRTLDKPVHVIHLDGEGKPAGIVTRTIVMVEEGASLTLIESYAGANARALQRNAVTEVIIGDKAAIDHIKLQREGEATVHLCTWLVRLGADARYGAFQFSTGAAVSRSQIFAALRRRRLLAQYLRRAFDARPPALRHHPPHRAQGTPLREPRAVQGRARQRGARRVPGQDHRLARRAEDRRQADGAGAAALRVGRVRLQARA